MTVSSYFIEFNDSWALNVWCPPKLSTLTRGTIQISKGPGLTAWIERERALTVTCYVTLWESQRFSWQFIVSDLNLVKAKWVKVENVKVDLKNTRYNIKDENTQ